MGEWGFEYPWVVGLVPFLILCLMKCPPRFETLWFPYADRLARIGRFRRDDIWLKVAILTLVALALASPVRRNEVVTAHDKGYEISLILDASGSMAQNGKFAIVKQIVKQFVKERRHDKIGLTIFADFAYVAVPLTYDKEALLRLLDKVEVGIAGTRRTALYEALFMSTKLFKRSKAKRKIAILLTDGMDNTGSVPLNVAIDTAKKYGISVYTIGVGQPGDYDPYVLEKIAKATGGKFFAADSAQKLERIYATIDKLEKSQISGNRYIQKRYYFAYPLIVALLLMLWIATEGFRVGRQKRGGV